MKLFLILAVIFSIYSDNSFASSNVSQQSFENKIQSFKSFVRPYLNQYFGEQKVNNWLGVKKFELQMPEIPKNKSKAYDVSGIAKVKNTETSRKFSKDLEKKYGYAFLTELLKVVRNKKVDSKEVEQWLGALLQGGSREGIYRAIVLDNTYKRLENFERPLNDQIIIFIKYYFKTYLNKDISDESLEKIDFYSLKRFLVEKSLEIVDVFYINGQDDKSDLYAWYSLFSKDVALKYPTFFKENVMRKESDLKKQYIWAKSVPFQHLKSEVILKLHIILNSLQNI